MGVSTNYEAARVASLSKDLLRLILLNPIFTGFKQSVLAASVLILSINISTSPAACKMGFPSRITTLKPSTGPLTLWTPFVESLTTISPESISTCYQNLTDLVQENGLFNGQLC